MDAQKLNVFLEGLGFSQRDLIQTRENVFTYVIQIDDFNSEKITFIYTPTLPDIYESHKYYWNRNDINSFIAIGDEKTHIINTKAKPNPENPVASSIKIDSFNYGINTSGYEWEKIFEWNETRIISKEYIDSGYFFDYIVKHRRKTQEVDKDLLLNLIALRNDLLEIKNDEEIIHLLILRCLFIKYLEDKGIYTKGHLTDALGSGNPEELISAFDEIKKINGDIFDKKISEEDIESAYLNKLWLFFNYDYLSGQGRLFPYLFDQIPIQLISHVYEAFLHNDERHGKGIYYTPNFLVSFMLSHSLKKRLETKKNVTVLDPAAGSGAFLVESFREIVKAQGSDISYNQKKEILQNQLFGIDIDLTALQIATFSLYLALIETEDPAFIREQIEKAHPILPTLLGKNLVRANALVDDVFSNIKFDCILSNPPWGSVKPTEPDSENIDLENLREREAIDEKGEEGTVPEYKNVSDYERSQAFLIRVQKWGNEETKYCLIVKNSIFLNANSEDFRKELLGIYQLDYFYELSNYNKILFKKHKIGEINGEPIVIGATEPCAVLVFESSKTADHKVKYISPKLNDFAENFQAIHYTQKDVIEVEQDRFIHNDLLWRVLVNGDFEDFKLITTKLLSENGLKLECRTGFQPKTNMKSLGEPDYKDWIKPTHFERYVINKPLARFNWNQELHRKRDDEVFQGNRVIAPLRPLRSHEYKLSGIRTNDNNLVYADDILCYKLQDAEKCSFDDYSVVLAILNSKVIGYALFNISAQWGKEGGMKRAKLRNVDIETFVQLPLLNFESKVCKQLKAKVAKIEALKKQNIETRAIENEIDELIFDLYNLKEYEKEIIREFYDVRVERIGRAAYVRSSDIEKYVRKFTEIFNLVIKPGSRLVAIKYNISLNLGTIVCFTILNKDKELTFENDRSLELLHLVKNEQLKQADATKILNEGKVKIYDGKLMFIIKSNLYKDWTIRQAIRDAREELNLILATLPENNGE